VTKGHAADDEHLDAPVYWFVVLEEARERGDVEMVKEALRQLRRLGVEVHFRRPPESLNGDKN
jgi:hypothetical protein